MSCIQEYDKEKGTSLLDILYTYLMYGTNISAAANAAGMGIKKMAAFLEAIEKLFGIDFGSLCVIIRIINIDSGILP